MAGRETAPSYVWVLRDKRPVPVRVKKGLTDGRSTEVLSGEVGVGLNLLVDLAGKAK
jgi:hypothetical protein